MVLWDVFCSRNCTFAKLRIFIIFSDKIRYRYHQDEKETATASSFHNNQDSFLVIFDERVTTWRLYYAGVIKEYGRKNPYRRQYRCYRCWSAGRPGTNRDWRSPGSQRSSPRDLRSHSQFSGKNLVGNETTVISNNEEWKIFGCSVQNSAFLIFSACSSFCGMGRFYLLNDLQNLYYANEWRICDNRHNAFVWHWNVLHVPFVRVLPFPIWDKSQSWAFSIVNKNPHCRIEWYKLNTNTQMFKRTVILRKVFILTGRFVFWNRFTLRCFRIFCQRVTNVPASEKIDKKHRFEKFFVFFDMTQNHNLVYGKSTWVVLIV